MVQLDRKRFINPARSRMELSTNRWIFCQFISVTSHVIHSDLGRSCQTLQCLILASLVQLRVAKSVQRFEIVSTFPILLKLQLVRLYDVLSASMVRFFDLSNGLVSFRYMMAHLYEVSVVSLLFIGNRQCLSATSQSFQSHSDTFCIKLLSFIYAPPYTSF